MTLAVVRTAVSGKAGVHCLQVYQVQQGSGAAEVAHRLPGFVGNIECAGSMRVEGGPVRWYTARFLV